MSHLIMYLIVRESLGMSPGKIGAQCGHAVRMALYDYFQNSHSPENAEKMQRWFTEGGPRHSTKVVLRADDKEWEKLKAYPMQKYIVQDAGLTEIAAGSETVMACWPMAQEDRPKIMRRLQTL